VSQSGPEKASIKDPALQSFDHKVSISRSKWNVPEGRARLRPTITNFTVQPEAKLSFPSSYGETVDSSPGKVRILPGPFEHLELRLGGEEKTLPCAVEMIPKFDGARDEGSEDILLNILDTEQRGAAGPGLELPVQSRETEAVTGGGEEKSPGSPDDARRKLVGQPADQVFR